MQNDQKFAVFVLAQVLGLIPENARQALLTPLTTQVPGLDIQAVRSGSVDIGTWQNTICPRIVEHFATKYEGGRLKTAV